ncbi:phosphomannomutase/phosphoglucomutase [Aliiroseovarius sp. S2029]|uniref:phosphomannomutase/phosphoglucomutase n=1 Tax=Aliiroseovarius sp. S2029 TaxID=2936988 RepID=UPI0020C046EA|nr:phosphomannomutase/phosphoglucomutase [Aliiroseovarius sp. S2029]MCK8482796.1 phosphomannomutase/phosphoglucomutase [Aliiroseovarius sp. S2029]
MRISPSGFREYDARWRYPEDLDLEGMQAVGLGLGTQMARRGRGRKIIVGHDHRSYSPAVRDALCKGLVQAGAHVCDIGMSLSPMAYFAQFHMDVDAVAMVTASHNPNGWTGIKVGFDRPCTHGVDEMAELRDIVLSRAFDLQDGGSITPMPGVQAAYLADLAQGGVISRPLRVVCATGNGTAGAFAPDLLRRLGVDVIERHCGLDHSFPHYNPNPEALEMLDDMGAAVRDSAADFGIGLDGDGDRIGIVDQNGRAVFADKLGVLIARDLAVRHPGAKFLADVKSTGVFAIDPVLASHGATVEYCKTGHSHVKQRLRESGALAAFEKSGHIYFGPPVGRGYDCALRAAVAVCRLMDHQPSANLSDLVDGLPPSWCSPTLSPACPDDQKYAVVDRLTDILRGMQLHGDTIAGQPIVDILTANGARVQFGNGDWALVRASSNTPNLVVVCESFESQAQLHALFAGFDEILRQEPAIGAYDQGIGLSQRS